MRKTLLLHIIKVIMLFLPIYTTAASPPVENTHFYKIKFKTIKKGTANRHFIWLHADETTAKTILEKHISKYDGTAFFIQNKQTYRFIVIDSMVIDPNRLFSSIGLKTNIYEYNKQQSAKQKDALIETLNTHRDLFLSRIFPPKNGLLIALHNTIRDHSVHKEKFPSSQFSIKKNQNPKDFILCTNLNDYNILKQSPFNVVLQKNQQSNSKGSLSNASIKNQIRYICIETRLNQANLQQKMLTYVVDLLP